MAKIKNKQEKRRKDNVRSDSGRRSSSIAHPVTRQLREKRTYGTNRLKYKSYSPKPQIASYLQIMFETPIFEKIQR